MAYINGKETMFYPQGDGKVIEVIPEGYVKPSGVINITENKTVDVTGYASAKVNVPIPSGYIKPSGTKSITENNKTFDVTQFASVKVNIPTETPEVIPDHADSDFTLHHRVGGGSGELDIIYSSTEKVAFEAAPEGAVIDTLQDQNFVPSNIKKGVEIFGVTGEYEGSTDSPLPIEVSTEAEMTALLTSGQVGGVYKYTGTTGTYENGALYVLEKAIGTFTHQYTGDSTDTTTYEFEVGMTWAEWAESDYDTNYLCVVRSHGLRWGGGGAESALYSNGVEVSADDLIISGATYTSKYMTGGGGSN